MAGLRRIGLTHPLDSKPLVLEAGEGYPPHVLNELAPRTEKRVREFLHSRGWPLEATVSMLSGVVAGATAEKALYKLGYRYSQNRPSVRGKPNIWVANAEITGWHDELLKNHPVNSTPDVEVKLREPEPVCVHTSWEQSASGSRKCADCGEDIGPILVPREDAFDAPPVPEVKVELREQPEPYKNPGKTIGETASPEFLEKHVDFIDDRDSWVVPIEDLFNSVTMRMMDDQLRVLRAVGMDYEIRVWRKK